MTYLSFKNLAYSVRASGLLHDLHHPWSFRWNSCNLTTVVTLDDTNLTLKNINDLLLNCSFSISLACLLVLNRCFKRLIKLDVSYNECNDFSVIFSEHLIYFLSHHVLNLLSLRKEIWVSVILWYLLNGVLKKLDAIVDYLCEKNIISLIVLLRPFLVNFMQIFLSYSVHNRHF